MPEHDRPPRINGAQAFALDRVNESARGWVSPRLASGPRTLGLRTDHAVAATESSSTERLAVRHLEGPNRLTDSAGGAARPGLPDGDG